MMDISAAGLNVLTEREGCVLRAYKDSRGILTIGVGHTAAAGLPHPVEGMAITEGEAEQILHRDLAPIIAALNALGVEMAQCEFDALASLTFNIGLPAFERSTVRRMLVAGNFNAAGRAILMWNEPPEIRARREGEYVQFTHGEYVARVEEKVA